MVRIYLDYAASTPLDKRVLRAMDPYFSKKFANPGSLHSFGQEAISAVDASRESIAKSIGADFREVIFTGSATEANNLALRGVVAKFKSDHPGVVPKVITSSIEHESVLETARALEGEGVEVVYLPVDREGVVDLDALKAALDERAVLVSIMYANNEVGTIQPIREIARIIKDVIKSPDRRPLLHTDAAQAFQFLDCNVRTLGIDLMTFSSHKMYGPKGVGALYIHNKGAKKEALVPIITGGGQEFGMRSGTENVPAIVGFAKAVELASASREAESKNIEALRERLWGGIKKAFPEAESNGPSASSGRLPNILNVYFPGNSAEDLLTKFDLHGVAVSSGSACRSRATEASYVLLALGHSKERTRESIRFSLGRLTTKREIDGALKVCAKLFPGKVVL